MQACGQFAVNLQGRLSWHTPEVEGTIRQAKIQNPAAP
jgi:hypothetical protein